MYKRYIGNTGKYVTVDEPSTDSRSPAPDTASSEHRAGQPPLGGNVRPSPTPQQPQLPLNMDTGDILLLLVLLLLYLDSADEDFLIILVVVAFAVFK